MAVAARNPASPFSAAPGSLFREWDAFWFSKADPAALAAVRVSLAALMFYLYAATWPAASSLIGPDAWIDDAAMASLRANDVEGAFRGRFSLWHFLRSPTALHASYAAFLGAIAAMGCGWKPRWAVLAVLAFHLSFVHRSLVFSYGVDNVCSLLLLYLLVCPGETGERRRDSVEANVALRLIQLHLCLIYLAAGLSKLQGASWWAGTAAMQTMLLPERWPGGLRFDFLMHWPVAFEYASNLLTYATLAFEVAFPFLIWRPALGPWFIAGACLFHVGVVLFMGMGAFSLAMAIALLAFVPGEQVQRGIRVFRRIR